MSVSRGVADPPEAGGSVAKKNSPKKGKPLVKRRPRVKAPNEGPVDDAYAYCPGSMMTGYHSLVAAQIMRGPKSYWFMCSVCGTRTYFPSKRPKPGFTADQVKRSGALVPNLV